MASLLLLVSHLQVEFDDTKEVIRIRKSKQDKQHNGQMKKDKQRSTKHTHMAYILSILVYI